MIKNGAQPTFWLSCQLDKGMFSDEAAVTYPSVEDCRASVFVPIDEVQGEFGTRGKVRVSLVQHDGTTFAVLPTVYRDIVAINKSDVVEE